ncbi:MAG: LysR family transcriptional regulator [Coriobacteriia bacterium]|nr:LysR family transcriptional regulator [Coriobacteriia bacterium]
MEHLYEYVVFTQRMSFSRASAELHMTQSSLSKHIHQLETELGFPLVSRYNNKVSITTAGGHFLNGLVPLLESFESLKEECLSLHEHSQSELRILEPPYSDQASFALFGLLVDFKDNNPYIGFKYARIHGRSTQEALLSGKIDLVLEYRYGNVEEILDDYKKRNLTAVHLLRVPVLLWCDHQHALIKSENIHIGDLRTVPIMTASDIYSPMRGAIFELCEKNGFKPLLNYDSSTLKVEYLFASPPESVYLLPDGLQSDSRMLSRTNMVFLPIEEAFFESFVVLGPHCEQDGSLGRLRDFLETRDCG